MTDWKQAEIDALRDRLKMAHLDWENAKEDLRRMQARLTELEREVDALGVPGVSQYAESDEITYGVFV